MNTKKCGVSLGFVAAATSFIYLLLFLIFYIPSYVSDGGWMAKDALVYLVAFLTDPVTELFEGVIASLVSVILARRLCLGRGVRGTALDCLLLALPALVYLLPYYYLNMLYNGYDSVEGILLSLLISSGITVLEALRRLLLVGVFFLAVRGVGYKRLVADLPPAEADRPSPERRRELKKKAAEDIPALLSEEGGIFNTAVPYSLAALAVSLAELAYRLVLRIIDIAAFFYEIDGAYLTEDIIYMTVCFVFCPLTLLASQAAASLGRPTDIRKEV